MATAPTPPVSSTATLSAPEGNRNLVVAAGTYVVNSFKKFADGSSQLWKNYQSVKDIKVRMKAPDGRVSYSEFMLVQTGAEDRAKLINLGLMMTFASEMMPYCFMFFPNMMPSTFGVPTEADEIAKYEKISRVRSHAVVEACMSLEGAVHKSPNMFASMNPFGGEARRKAQERSMLVVARTVQLLGAAADGDEMGAVLDLLDDAFLSPNSKEVRDKNSDAPPTKIFLPPNRLEQRLGSVPKQIVKGAFKCEGLADPLFVIPHFSLRNTVVAHLDRIKKADNFLAKPGVDLASLTRSELTDACDKRFIRAGPGRSDDDLRDELASWLNHSPCIEGRADTEAANGVSPLPNDNLKLVAMLGYNAVIGAKDTASGSMLPRLVFDQ